MDRGEGSKRKEPGQGLKGLFAKQFSQGRPVAEEPVPTGPVLRPSSSSVGDEMRKKKSKKVRKKPAMMHKQDQGGKAESCEEVLGDEMLDAFELGVETMDDPDEQKVVRAVVDILDMVGASQASPGNVISRQRN